MAATDTGGTMNAAGRARSSERSLVTPEGVPLKVHLAGRTERLAALLIDLVIIGGVIFVLMLILSASLLAGGYSPWLLSAALVVWFLIRSFYFIFFELRWQGATPGKKATGIRVVDRRGGQLKADAIFARNLMREVELYLPISLMLAQPGWADRWVWLSVMVWLGVFVMLPFFNRDRMRAGDIVGGTWVIRQPKSVLLPDVAAADPDKASGTAPMQFTDAQLDAYGIYELQTLETVLRQNNLTSAATVTEVAKRVRKKIEWSGPTDDARAFLEAFYAALRARLEARMLLGQRREHKDDGERPRH